ncbi:uncharacterized protein LOC123428958 [Hordeum vulgare subsp. vulgare]|uniref:uncharacterized protein LOC123428958 n=1 Tax=Hordeum vulgare subsp. vulgare TaxID=112509 RepID=UPI001D1A5A07|nr:uncharacterized protein LOC123428958 [Hordeum vulgare subsp. vulgare]
MQFTHCIPGIIPPRAAVIESTLQIYSFKITGLSDDLKWPLNVYGVIAARDTVDHNRNLLFSRSSIMCQVLTSENDFSLRLTGPSRAILAKDPVDFEVELRVHDGCDPRGDGLNDRKLICASSRYEVATSSELPLACLGIWPSPLYKYIRYQSLRVGLLPRLMWLPTWLRKVHCRVILLVIITTVGHDREYRGEQTGDPRVPVAFWYIQAYSCVGYNGGEARWAVCACGECVRWDCACGYCTCGGRACCWGSCSSGGWRAGD